VQTQHPTTLAGRYALQEELGRSGTGMAWRADDRLLGRTVTIKLIHPSLGDDPAFAERLAREARLVASVSAPGLVRLLDTGEQDGVPFLVREHVEGTSAGMRLASGGPLAPAEAAETAIAVLEALSPAHEAGLLHLHLRPEDVLFAPDGHVRVTDLGIGQVVAATRAPGDVLRLLGGGELPPEMAGDDPPDVRADVFEVGALLFELLTGTPPSGRRSPRAVEPVVPKTLDRVVAHALAPNPEERYESARAFARALRAATPATRPRDAQRRGWLGTWLGVPIAIVVVALATTGVGLWLGRLEVGGPLGIRPADERSASSAVADAVPTEEPVQPASASVFDPFGDQSENDSTAPLSIDGDPASAWRSENYFDGRLNKDGVGVVFDLGQSRDVVGFRLSTPHPGFLFQVAVGDDPATLLEGLSDVHTADLDTRGSLTGSGRYVLVWITTVVDVGDGNRAEIGEFEVTLESHA
jgi:hypothetical protein